MTLALEINASSQTWVRVTSDGTVAFADILQPGAERRFSAERSLNVTIGNAAGVTLKINGRELKELGPEGKVRELIKHGSDALQMALEKGMTASMNRYNTK